MPEDFEEMEKKEEEYEVEDAEYLEEQKHSDEYGDEHGESIAPRKESGLEEKVFKCMKCKKTTVVKEDEEMLGPPVHCGRIMKEVSGGEEELIEVVKQGRGARKGEKKTANLKKKTGGKKIGKKRNKRR